MSVRSGRHFAQGEFHFFTHARLYHDIQKLCTRKENMQDERERNVSTVVSKRQFRPFETT